MRYHLSLTKLVAQVAFQEWKGDGRLRQSSLLGMCDGKNPPEYLLPSIYRMGLLVAVELLCLVAARRGSGMQDL